MKTHLLFADRDAVDATPRHADDLVRDLGLDTLFETMAGGDGLVREIVRRTMLSSLDDPAMIRYRQRILADWLEHPALLRELYTLAGDALAAERRAYFSFGAHSPELALHGAVRVLEILLTSLRQLRALAERSHAAVRSDGLRRFWQMVRTELDGAYLDTVEHCLHELRFERGIVMSARLGSGNRGSDYVLRRIPPDTRRWFERLLPRRPSGLWFEIPPRDEVGARALATLRTRGINDVANAARQAVNHVIGFFDTLHSETAFYLGCLNLRDALARIGGATCTPEPRDAAVDSLTATGLYDVTLALRLRRSIVSSDVCADGKRVLVVTGPNQGGKTTFLRALGVAQLMLQCGMFVGAQRFAANVVSGQFTHYRREEDAALERGKLEEELRRMSAIADSVRPRGLVLCNESFSSTNEREGSEIGRQVVRAFRDSGVKVVYVTHLYDMADGLRREGRDDALFLRAERLDEGRRTFRVVPGEPLDTSFGRDLYEEVFGGGRAAAGGPPT